MDTKEFQNELEKRVKPEFLKLCGNSGQRRVSDMIDKRHEKQEATSEEKVGGFTVRKGTGIVVQRGMDICPYCEEKHEVETVMMVKIVCIGGENLLAFEFSQYCEKADDFYQTEKQFNESVELEKTIMKTEKIEIAELKVDSETAKMIVETLGKEAGPQRADLDGVE